MSFQTVPVTCVAKDPRGNPIAGAIFEFMLATKNEAGKVIPVTEIYQGLVVPEKVIVEADDQGQCVVALFPNELGIRASQYLVTATNPEDDSVFLYGLATVPNTPCNLHEVLDLLPIPPLDAAQAAVLQAQAIQTDVNTSKGQVVAAQNDVTTKAGEVDVAHDEVMALQPQVTAAAKQAPSKQDLADSYSIVWDIALGKSAFLTLSTKQGIRKLENLENIEPGAIYPLTVKQHPQGSERITDLGNLIMPAADISINPAPNSLTVFLALSTGDGVILVKTGGSAAAQAPGNTAPVNVAPTAVSTPYQTACVLSVAKGNVITVSDADGDTLTTTLAVPLAAGTLTVVTGTGAAVTANGTATVTVQGKAAQINASLDGMTFTPKAGYSGDTNLQVSTTDGTATDTDVVVITVATNAGATPYSGQTITFGSQADGVYPYGTVPPLVASNFAAAKANILAHFLAMYDDHFITSMANLPGGMAPRKSGTEVVSEGVGYWMLLCTVMEGAQSDPSWGSRLSPQAQFDGCLKTALTRGAFQYQADRPSDPYGAESAAHLMEWRIWPDGRSYGDPYSAPDGDLDIALALIMADRQWGSTGTYNYADLATKRINALKHRHYRPDGTGLAMKKPVGYAGDSTPFNMVRPSDFMFNHFRAFARHTQDPFWKGQTPASEGTGNVFDRQAWLANYIQTTFSPSGLLPDFIEGTELGADLMLAKDRLGHGDPPLILQMVDNPPYNNVGRIATPADIARGVTVNGVPVVKGQWIDYDKGTTDPDPATWLPKVNPGLEDVYDNRGKYFDSNACRISWRFVTDYVFSNDPTVKTLLDRVNTFWKNLLLAHNNDPTWIQDSYKLDGTVTQWAGQGEFTEVLGPVMAGFCSDATYATQLDKMWQWNTGLLGGRNEKGYYSGEIQLFSKMVAAGIWWEPYPNGPIPASVLLAPTNTVPAAQTVALNTPLTFSVAAGRAITVSDSDSGSLTTLVAVPVNTGTLTAAAGSGAAVTNDGTRQITIKGTSAQINAALNGLVYTPANGYSGDITLKVTTTDDSLTDIDTVAVSVISATGPSYLTSVFSEGNTGFWGDASQLTYFHTLSTNTTNPSGYGDGASVVVSVGRWINRGAPNGTRNLVQTDGVKLFNIVSDVNGKGTNVSSPSPLVGVGGYTGDFYAAYCRKSNSYASTVFSDMNVAGTSGRRLRYDGNNSRYYFEVATSGGLVTVMSAKFVPNFQAPGKRVVRVRIKAGVSIGIRVDNGAWIETAIPAGFTLVGGTPDMMLGGNTDGTSAGTGPFYGLVILNQLCPADADEALVATWVAAQGTGTV